MVSLDNAEPTSGNLAPKKSDKNDANGLKTAEKKPRGKTIPSQNHQSKGTKKRRKRKDIHKNYTTYIYRVLKFNDVSPDCGISNKAMSIMNSAVLDVMERVARASAELATHNKKATITARTIQSATKLTLPSDLRKYADGKAVKAVDKYAKATGRKSLLG